MRSDLERRRDADLVAGCLTRDQAALARLADLFIAALCAPVGRRLRRRLGCDQEMIEDAEQEVWCRLLTKPGRVLGKFEPARASPAAYLIGRVRRRARVLGRGERRHHARERAASVAEAADPDVEADGEGLAGTAWPRLTPWQRAFVTGLRQGKLPEEFQGLSPAALRQLVCRIRRKVQEPAAASDGGEAGKEK
jgi:DNA-directed RNA polymerase specialized sigma24 family protein